MKRPHTITDPIEIQRIRIGFFLMNRLKLWGFTSMLWGFINLWWIPFKRYGGTHRFFYRENRRSKAAFPIRKRPHVRYRPDMGPLHHILKGTESFMPSRGWGTRRAGPLPFLQAFPDVFQTGKDRAMGTPCVSFRAYSHYAELFQWLKRVGRNFQHRSKNI